MPNEMMFRGLEYLPLLHGGMTILVKHAELIRVCRRNSKLDSEMLEVLEEG